jgi:hypothetical protein
LFVEHIVEAHPAEGSFVSCLVNVPEGEFSQSVIDLGPEVPGYLFDNAVSGKTGGSGYNGHGFSLEIQW